MRLKTASHPVERHCGVHQMFQAEHVAMFREQHPGINIMVTECPQEVNDIADVSGSTGKIIVIQAEPGSKWAIGTELHLVNRLKKENPRLGTFLP